MLIVDERFALVTLAGLKQLRRAAGRNVAAAGVDELADGERFEREHPLNRQCSRAQRPHAGDHEPVLRLPRGEVGEQPLLVVEPDEDVGVAEPGPVGGRGAARRMVVS
jgi:hypothetical protein